jgi:mRNA interferase RelE/StbE
MKYWIILSPDAKNNLVKMKGNLRSIIRDGIIEHLNYEPEKVSKSRIKKLKGLEKPQYRLRIDDVRIYYDINKNMVEILAIATKELVGQWLERSGK